MWVASMLLSCVVGALGALSAHVRTNEGNVDVEDTRFRQAIQLARRWRVSCTYHRMANFLACRQLRRWNITIRGQRLGTSSG